MQRLAGLGIDMDQVTGELVDEGIEKFVTPFQELMAALDGKRTALAAGRR
jgi:transaldolase